MSFRIALLALVVAALPGHGAVAAGAGATPEAGADEAAVRKIVQQVQDGWNAHDAKAFAAPFAANADYVIVNGMKIEGREAIENGHVGIFATIYKDSRNVATIRSVRFLRPDVAVVHVEWNLEFQAGGQPQKAQAMNTMVMTKEGGHWSIAAFQNTPIQTQPR